MSSGMPTRMWFSSHSSVWSSVVSAKGHRDRWLLPRWDPKTTYIFPLWEELHLGTGRRVWVPGKVISTSQFSVGTVFIHALWDTR